MIKNFEKFLAFPTNKKYVIVGEIKFEKFSAAHRKSLIVQKCDKVIFCQDYNIRFYSNKNIYELKPRFFKNENDSKEIMNKLKNEYSTFNFELIEYNDILMMIDIKNFNL